VSGLARTAAIAPKVQGQKSGLWVCERVCFFLAFVGPYGATTARLRPAYGGAGPQGPADAPYGHTEARKRVPLVKDQKRPAGAMAAALESPVAIWAGEGGQDPILTLPAPFF
jgi:hypothetical protein